MNEPQISDYHIYQRGSTWHVGYRINGKLIHKTTKQTDKTLADQAAKRIWVEAKKTLSTLASGIDPLAKASVLFNVYRERKLAERSKKALNLHDNFVKRFGDFFKSNPLLASISKYEEPLAKVTGAPI